MDVATPTRGREGARDSTTSALRSVGRHLGAVSIATRRATQGLRLDLEELRENADPLSGGGREALLGELVEAVIARTDEVRDICENLLGIVKGAAGEQHQIAPRPRPIEVRHPTEETLSYWRALAVATASAARAAEAERVAIAEAEARVEVEAVEAALARMAAEAPAEFAPVPEPTDTAGPPDSTVGSKPPPGAEPAESSLVPDLPESTPGPELALGSDQPPGPAPTLGFDQPLGPAPTLAPEPSRAPEPPLDFESEPPPPSASEIAAGLRVIAIQMAVSGAAPIEIAARLREGFGVVDADAIVARILGGRD